MSFKRTDVNHLWKRQLKIRTRDLPCFFVPPAFVGAICRAEGGWAPSRDQI